MARKLSRYNDAIRQHAVIDAWDTSTNTLAPISYLEYVTSPNLAAATFAQNTSYPLYTSPNDGKTWQITGISYRFSTQSTAASTFNVEIAGAAVAPGSGVNQTSAALTLQGTANTTINASNLLATPTVFGAGSSINLVVTNTNATTGLAGLVITVTMQRVT